MHEYRLTVFSYLSSVSNIDGLDSLLLRWNPEARDVSPSGPRYPCLAPSSRECLALNREILPTINHRVVSSSFVVSYCFSINWVCMCKYKLSIVHR